MNNRYLVILVFLVSVFFYPYNASSYKVMVDPSSNKEIKWWISPGDKIGYWVNPYFCIGNTNCLVNTAQDLIDVVKQSFQTWEDVAGSFVAFEYKGVSYKTEIGTCDNNNCYPDGISLLIWETNWPYEQEVIGLTTNWYNPDTGQMVSADIEFNLANYRWMIITSLNQCSPQKDTDVVDIQNIVTHEAGHFIGLDHSDVENSTMFATSPPCETSKRALDEDDIDGVVYLYPDNAVPEVSGVEPTNFYTDQESAEMSVYGKNFRQEIMVYLTSTGYISGSYSAKSVEYINSGEVKATFNFTYIDPGLYTVIVEQSTGGGKVRDKLADAVNVKQGEKDSPGGCATVGGRNQPFLFLEFLILSLLMLYILPKWRNW